MFSSCTRSRVRIEPCTVVFETTACYHSASRNGRIVCICSHEEAIVEWTNLDDEADASDNGMEVKQLLPGTYTCNITLDFISWECSATVGDWNACLVKGYVTEDTSTDNSRDGRIEARIENVPLHAEFLWTTGVITKKPVLEDVSPGKYSVSILCDDCVCVFLCDPCVVSVKTDPSSIVLTETVSSDHGEEY